MKSLSSLNPASCGANRPGRIKVIDRVGYDVNASCGMFAR